MAAAHVCVVILYLIGMGVLLIDPSMPSFSGPGCWVQWTGVIVYLPGHAVYYD